MHHLLESSVASTHRTGKRFRQAQLPEPRAMHRQGDHNIRAHRADNVKGVNVLVRTQQPCNVVGQIVTTPSHANPSHAKANAPPRQPSCSGGAATQSRVGFGGWARTDVERGGFAAHYPTISEPSHKLRPSRTITNQVRVLPLTH